MAASGTPNLSWARQEECFRGCEEGLAAFSNFELTRADATYAPFVKDSALAAFLQAEVGFMRAILSEDKGIIDRTKRQLEAAVKTAETILNKIGKDVPAGLPSEAALRTSSIIWQTRMAQGEAALWLASLRLKNQDNVKGVYWLRRSYKYFEKADDFRKALGAHAPSVPHFRDIASGVDTGLGFYHFIVSICPREWLWVIESVGFKADREAGLAEIKLAVGENSGFRSFLAHVHLTWIYAFFYQDCAAGLEWVKPALEKFPHAAQIHYLAGYVERKLGLIDQSEISFRKTIEYSANELEIMAEMAQYDVGYNQMFKLDFAGAKDTFTAIIKKNPTALKPYGYWQLAMCHVMLNEISEADKHFKYLLPKVRKGFEYDEFAKIKARRFQTQNNSCSEYEKQYFIASLLLEAMNFDGALGAIEEASKLAKNVDDQATTLYIQGACFQGQKAYPVAIEYFEKCLQLEKTISQFVKFVIPYSLTSLAEIHLEQRPPNVKDATTLLQKAKTYQGYDFSQLLGWRISFNLDVKIPSLASGGAASSS